MWIMDGGGEDVEKTKNIPIRKKKSRFAEQYDIIQCGTLYRFIAGLPQRKR